MFGVYSLSGNSDGIVALIDMKAVSLPPPKAVQMDIIHPAGYQTYCTQQIFPSADSTKWSFQSRCLDVGYIYLCYLTMMIKGEWSAGRRLAPTLPVNCYTEEHSNGYISINMGMGYNRNMQPNIYFILRKYTRCFFLLLFHFSQQKVYLVSSRIRNLYLCRIEITHKSAVSVGRKV